MKGKSLVDWASVESEYISSATSYRELGAKHGIGVAGLRKRGLRGEWARKRREFSDRVAARLGEETVETRVEQSRRWNEQDLQIAVAARGRVASEFTALAKNRTLPQHIRLSRLGAIIRMAVDVQRMGRLALGMTTDHAGVCDMEEPLIDPPKLGDLYATVQIVMVGNEAGDFDEPEEGAEH